VACYLRTAHRQGGRPRRVIATYPLTDCTRNCEYSDSVDVSELPPGVVLREAVASDIPTLIELARAFYDEDGFTTSNNLLRQNFHVLVGSTNARVTMVLRGEQVCGFALATTDFTLESGLIAELQDLYVRPEHRRQGLAGFLIQDAAGWANGMSASLLEVVIAPNGRDVSHLFRYYEARGFVDDGRRVMGRPVS
jgi:aminoglycoside 6'-N-acetyltransferase I